MYNLTPNQKDLLKWLVEQVRENNLPEEFTVIWGPNDIVLIPERKTTGATHVPNMSKGALDALASQDLIHVHINNDTKTAKSRYYQTERNRRITLLGKAYEAVDSDFSAPDVSFIKHLSRLADVTNLDNELKTRCLPILGAGSADPKLWDSAVRTAGVILEERLRDVGGIADPARVGRDLVNDVFGDRGTLAAKVLNASERLGYRDLYAGIVGVFRNPSAHRLTDPSPEDGGAYIVFVNLLLKMLEDLR